MMSVVFAQYQHLVNDVTDGKQSCKLNEFLMIINKCFFQITSIQLLRETKKIFDCSVLGALIAWFSHG